MTTGDTTKFVEAAQKMQIIAETVVGYHKKLVDGGVPAETASRMAEEFHTAILETMKANVVAQNRPRR
jgi:hypothetical protein